MKAAAGARSWIPDDTEALNRSTAFEIQSVEINLKLGVAGVDDFSPIPQLKIRAFSIPRF